jgi:hypothetical protein
MSTDPAYIKRHAAAFETLRDLSNLAMSMPEEERKAKMMGLTFTAALVYLSEYIHHLANDVDPYDAMLAAARGDRPLVGPQWEALFRQIEEHRQRKEQP